MRGRGAWAASARRKDSDARNLHAVAIFPHPPFAAYALLDSGNAEKLERFGRFVLRRPDPQALWRPRLSAAEWARRADLAFVRESDRGGTWEQPRGEVPEEWELEVAVGWTEPACLLIRPTPFKHVGLFPEQAANWAWVEERRTGLALRLAPRAAPRLLNLFAYTGAASVFAAKSGWEVTHVDASRASLDWAAENARGSALDANAIRWMLDDALAFARREARRGNRYHGILADPPSYGRGPKGEKWELETGLAPLLEACAALLEPVTGAFLALSTYAVGYSPLAYANMLREFGPGEIETGELALPEEESGRLLPCGFCARFTRT